MIENCNYSNQINTKTIIRNIKYNYILYLYFIYYIKYIMYYYYYVFLDQILVYKNPAKKVCGYWF